MLCKISSLATTVIIAAWYEHEADFDQKEADFCAKGWVNTTKERDSCRSFGRRTVFTSGRRSPNRSTSGFCSSTSGPPRHCQPKEGLARRYCVSGASRNSNV